MFVVNGVALDNDARGWWVSDLSQTLVEGTFERASLTRQGRDGVLGGVAAIVAAPRLPLTLRTSRGQVEELSALFGGEGVLSLAGTSTREIGYEVLSRSPVGMGPKQEIVDVTFSLRFPGVFWRAKTVATTTTPLASASVVVQPFPGLSASVQDAVIRVKGAATGLRVTDASGAWLGFDAIPAGKWLRVEGRFAFLTDTDTWTGGTDESGWLSQGGPRRRFEITPVFAPGDPSARSGRLTVTTASRSGAVIEVRGKSAHTQAER